jgi:MFS family permease
VGTAIEWYDFFIYGTAAAVVFGPQFLPQVSELARTLAAFAPFAIGFIARPIGGGVMGHYGDGLGRKFIGIEIEPKYFDIACRRIEQAYAQPDMFVSSPAKPVQEAML